MQTLLCCYQKRIEVFNDIAHLYKCYPFTILNNYLLKIPDEMNEEVVHITSDDFSPNNDLEDSNPTDSLHETQNQEVDSVLLPQKGINF